MNGIELLKYVEEKKQQFMGELNDIDDSKFRSEIAHLTLDYFAAWESALKRAKERQYDSYGTIRAIMDIEAFNTSKYCCDSETLYLDPKYFKYNKSNL